MPFGNYQELVDEVVDLVGRGRIRNKVPGWLQLAESEALAEVRDLREIKYKTTGNLIAGTATLTLPDAVMGIELFQLDESPVKVVKAASIDHLVERRAVENATSDRYPTMYAWNSGRTLEIAPTPEIASAYTIYYKGAMLDVNELKVTSNILEQAPNYLLYAAAWHCAVYTRNSEQEARFEKARDRYLRSYQKLASRLRDTPQIGSNVRRGDHPQTTGTSA